MPTPIPTVEELVSTLQRSHLPSIIVEGDDDLTIYRWIEDRIGSHRGNVLPCGGRSNLLALYDRRGEFSHLSTIFIADRDMWLFSTIPNEYINITWTTGYSIENDIYAGANLESLLNPDETVYFTLCLQSIVEWFAFEVEEFRSGREAQVRHHPKAVLQEGDSCICPRFSARRQLQKPSQQTINEILDNYKLTLRGKTLFQLLSHLLNTPARDIKYNIKSLYEIGFKLSTNPIHINDLINRIENTLQ